MTTSIPNSSTLRPLRLLIVDDNYINLSILSTLLKRRFSHVIDGAPVTVDSGLKAIQLLRTHIFDCILMDIQMPFLSGLDTTRRIRNAEDGILAANKDAHIVAVTTAVGDEPEHAYRRARMDGMIGKPVRYQQLQDYLCPLAREAGRAALSVQPLQLDGVEIMPPLPPSSIEERVFYLPEGAVTPSSRPDICAHGNFEQLLNRQTQTSLRQCAMSMAQHNDERLSPRSPKTECKDDIDMHCASEPYHQMPPPSTSSSRSNSASSMEVLRQTTDITTSPGSALSRQGSMTISRRVFCKQVAREVANLEPQEHLNRATTMVPHNFRRVQSRPQVKSRTSSPCWLLSDDSKYQDSKRWAAEDCSGASTVAVAEKTSHPIRPKLVDRKTLDSNDSSASSYYKSSDSDFHRRTSDTSSTRTDSRGSNGSTNSGASSTVTTPAYESPPPFFAAMIDLKSSMAKLSTSSRGGSDCDPTFTSDHNIDFQSSPVDMADTAARS